MCVLIFYYCFFFAVILLNVMKQQSMDIRSLIKNIQEGRRFVAYDYHLAIGEKPVPVAMRKTDPKERFDSDIISKIDRRVKELMKALREFKLK